MTREALEPGMIVRGTVVSVARHGLHLSLGKLSVVVFVSELAWSSTVDPSQVARVGDELDVLVIRTIEGYGAEGSLKRLRPDLDPWATPGTFAPGARFKAEIQRAYDDGDYRVRHPSGIEGELPGKLCLGRSFVAGEVVDVVVLSSDAEERTFTVGLG